jgi:hypothetical protein
MDKQLFVSEKFLTVASEDGTYSVMACQNKWDLIC